MEFLKTLLDAFLYACRLLDKTPEERKGERKKALELRRENDLKTKRPNNSFWRGE